MKESVYDDQPEILRKLIDVCVDGEYCDREKAKAFWSYYKSNYFGITIWKELGFKIGGSCAECLISHLLSASSMVWLPTGLGAVSGLIIYMLNGGLVQAGDFRGLAIN